MEDEVSNEVGIILFFFLLVFPIGISIILLFNMFPFWIALLIIIGTVSLIKIFSS